MKFTRVVSLLCLALPAIAAQFTTPEVENAVADALNDIDFDKSGVPANLKRQATPYWYETITHQGISAFGPNGYQVYRNVKDFGAKGDGVTDDTAAINDAISSGGRCGKGCASSTTTPAVVYFPSGTYLISSSILDQYYTQLIGNPNDPPTLKATAGFSGFGLIDGDKYYTADLNWVSTNVFNRQVRNFIFDLTNIPGTTKATGIHWPTAQATSLQNIVFQMNAESGTQHVGLFCESGSAGFLTDVTFNGGLIGAQVGNQQFTMRNLAFNNCVTAISQIWNWGWVYQGISINNCQTGINMSTGGSSGQAVGSVILIDSAIGNTPIGIITAYDPPTSTPPTAGSLIIENVRLSNVPIMIQSNGNTVLAGTTRGDTIAAWGEGHEYTSTDPKSFQGPITPNSRPKSLVVSDGQYYVQSKPQYNDLPVASFSSVRTAGATGNGITDDTSALQKAINTATAANKVVFFDAGTYLVTSTLLIPPGAKLVGEGYAVIMSSGSFFNTNTPQPVVRVGDPGETGVVQWSDMIVATQGPQSGAVLIEWNLASTETPSGMWDVHTRIGGFQGSKLQVAQCGKNPNSTAINDACIGAFMSMHITASASGLYMENNWFWTADHDIDDPANTQLSVYNGRGLLIESSTGPFWLVGTAVEHHTLYQYQLANTQNLYMGFIQTESPYYQPSPQAPAPFTPISSLNDPTFSDCAGQAANCYDSWGLRIVNSHDVLIYGAGHYSFFNNFDGTTCNKGNGPENCQLNMVDLEGTLTNVNIYCLNTVGVINMISKAGKSLALFSDNVNVYVDNIALFQLSAGTGGSVTGPTATSAPLSLPRSSSVLATSLSAITSLLSASLTPSTFLPGPTTMSTRTLSTPASSSATLPDTTSTVFSTSTISVKTTVTSSTRSQSHQSTRTSKPQGSSSGTRTSSSGSETATAGLSWCYRGCYTDTAARTLIRGQPSSKGMTVEKCQSSCKQRGYTLAGVEYGEQCFCDNTLQHGGVLAPDGDVHCNMPCAGNPAEICGGPNRLSLYSYDHDNGTALS